jgi:AbrB family looped-hinge helix DNA binding protein
MQAIAAQINSKYRVVIPKPVRELLRIRPHDTLLFLLDGDTVILRPRPTNFTDAMRGLYCTLWPDPRRLA